MCNVKLLLGNEEMTRTTCTAFVPFVDVVFIFFFIGILQRVVVIAVDFQR